MPTHGWRASFHPRTEQNSKVPSWRRARVCGNSSSPQSAETTSGTVSAGRADRPAFDRPTNGSAPRRTVRPVRAIRSMARSSIAGSEALSRLGRTSSWRTWMDPRSIRVFILTSPPHRAASCAGRSRWVDRVPFPLGGDGIHRICKPLAAGNKTRWRGASTCPGRSRTRIRAAGRHTGKRRSMAATIARPSAPAGSFSGL